MRDIFTSLFCFRKELQLRVGVGSNFDSVDLRRMDWRGEPYVFILHTGYVRIFF